MRTPPKDDLKVYFAEAASWDQDRLASARRSRRLAWAAAALATLLATCAVSALAMLAPLKEVEPFVVRVDRATGAVDVMRGLSSETDITPDEAVSKYFIAQYVRAREGWLAASAEADFRQVALLSSPAEQRRFAEARRPSHPDDPATAFGEDAMAAVEVRAISFINDRVASVRFRRTIWRLQGVATQDWVAVVSFAYTKAPMRESDRLLNPLGFQVNAYRIDPEVS